MRVDFGSLGVNFASLWIKFRPVRVDFGPFPGDFLKFGPLRVDFGSSGLNFWPLQVNFWSYLASSIQYQTSWIWFLHAFKLDENHVISCQEILEDLLTFSANQFILCSACWNCQMEVDFYIESLELFGRLGVKLRSQEVDPGTLGIVSFCVIPTVSVLD